MVDCGFACCLGCGGGGGRVQNSIGYGNHGYYLALLCGQSANLLLAALLALRRLQQGPLLLASGGEAGGGGPPLAVLLLFVFCVVGLVADVQVLAQQVRQVSANLTTHEHFNAHRCDGGCAGGCRHFAVVLSLDVR